MKREEIVKLIEELHWKVTASQGLSQLEIDIVKDDIKALYTKVLELQPDAAGKEPEQAPEMHVVQPAEPEVIPAPVEPEPPVVEESPKVEEPDITPSYEETVQPPVVEPTPPVETPAPEPQASEVEMEKEDIPEPTPEPTPEPIVTQQPEKKDHIVAERLEANQQDNTLAGKWNKNPIADLKSAIGLNEKYSFIHGLFKGKVDSYNEAIDKLNSSGGVDAAKQYLEFLSNEYSWNNKSEEYLKLKNFVERRFS